MKKLIIVAALTASVFSSFGQGYFSFTGNPRTAWDGFTTTSVSKNAATMNVGFLFGTGSALISAIASSVPTNSTVLPNSSTVAAAWNAILNDANFTVASTGGNQVVQATAANGSWSYNGAATFGVTGSGASTYSVIVFGWSSAYSTAAAAALAGSAVGWSTAFSYTAVSSIGTPSSMALSGLTGFGVTAAPVPEPGTIALAGLGGLGLLALRRRNK